MNPNKITIAHEIPGRIRLRLRTPPRDLSSLAEAIEKHDGIKDVCFNQVTRSLLVLYKPTLVSSIEIAVRTAMVLSLEKQNAPIEICREGSGKPLKPLDYYAGVTLLLSLVARSQFLLRLPKNIEYHAAAATTLSVLNHAWQEIQEEGVYHPEVLSAVYLISSVINGNILKASVLTWLLTFGRHLLDVSGDACVIQALEVKEGEKENYVDAMARPRDGKAQNPMQLILTILGKSMGVDVGNSGHPLMENITEMSREHGNVLEGLGKGTGRVYMRINQ